MSKYESFRDIVASSDHLRAVWKENSQYAAARIKDMLDIDVSVDDILALDSVRNSTLGGSAVDELEMLEEAKSLGAVLERNRRQQLAADIAAGEHEALEKLGTMSRQQRMTYARENGLTGGAGNDAASSSAANEATLLKRLLALSPQQRLAKGRAWGLIP